MKTITLSGHQMDTVRMAMLDRIDKLEKMLPVSSNLDSYVRDQLDIARQVLELVEGVQ